mmetsp:Transcript_15258/g.22084  ORF Transcript_15258/g.22084 Transcript_15258/m.22084 type:complete len:583 (-) Transcript_15258:447-2195(-)
MGKYGQIDEEQCALLPTNTIQTECGCAVRNSTSPISETTPSNICSVCGNGDSHHATVMAKPDAVVQFESAVAPDAVTTAITTTCRELAQMAHRGDLDNEQCQSLSTTTSIHDQCGCIDIPVLPTTPAATTTTTTTTTPAPSPASSSDHPPCFVCGLNQKVSIPDAEVQIESSVSGFFNSITTTCAVIEKEGQFGQFDANQCFALQFIAHKSCGCTAITVTETTSRPCSICGDNLIITRPWENVEVESVSPSGITTTETTTCGALDLQGRDGDIDHTRCAALPSSIYEACGCRRPCSVCGGDDDSLVVTNPHGEVSIDRSISPTGGYDPNFLTTITTTCGALVEMGRTGQFDTEHCAALPTTAIRNKCGCAPRCSICGGGKTVTNPDTEIQIDWSSSHFSMAQTTTCWELAQLGDAGEISQNECAALPDMIYDKCGCSSEPQSPGPTPPAPYSFAVPGLPGRAPTSSPYSPNSAPSNVALGEKTPSTSTTTEFEDGGGHKGVGISSQGLMCLIFSIMVAVLITVLTVVETRRRKERFILTTTAKEGELLSMVKAKETGGHDVTIDDDYIDEETGVEGTGNELI